MVSVPEPPFDAAPGPQTAQVADALGREFRRHVESLAPVAEMLADCGRAAAGEAITEQSLAGLGPLLRAWLDADNPSLGGGYVAAPGVVEGRDRFLFWLQRYATGIRRLHLNFAAGVDLYDYDEREWFARARATGEPAVMGPYVDYGGAGEFVLTVSVPVSADGRFLGVVGSDQLMRSIEGRLVGLLLQCSSTAVLFNTDRNVIATNSPRWLPGERIAASAVAGPRRRFAEIAPIGHGSNWWVAVGDSDDDRS